MMLVSEILSNANGLIENGFNDKAITLLADNFQQQNESPQIHFQLIHLLQQQGDFENSEKVLFDAEKKFAGLLQLILFRSSQSKGIGNHPQSIQYLYQYLEVNQENPIVWATLGQLLEQLNRLPELEELFNKIPQTFTTRPLIALVKAKLFRRQSKLPAALEILNDIEDYPNNQWLSASIDFEYSRIFDKLGEYNKAWDSATEANNSTANVWPKRWQQSDQIGLMLKQYSKQPISQNDAKSKQQSPCFIIGFPRSGTTLLDRILESHSNIVVINEEPLIEGIVNQLGGFDYFSKLEKLTVEETQYFRKQYFSQLKTIQPNFSEDNIIIDKLPLNLLYIPLINTIFPESRIILSIRHPIDSCLSCYFQEFVAAPALAKFLSFESSVDFYQQLFSSTEFYLEKNSNVFNIRYEDILSDLESSLTGLLEFLGLDWQPQLENFHQHSENKPINTPSYHQVVQPLYKDSVYRWKNYEKYCSSANKKLNYWIDKFGYSEK